MVCNLLVLPGDVTVGTAEDAGDEFEKSIKIIILKFDYYLR